MNSTDIFALDYKVGTRQFVLNKTDLRSIDRANAKNNFTIPLADIDPHYRFGGALSPLFILFLMYMTFGVIARSTQWLTGSKLFDAMGSTQLIVFSVVLIFSVYRLYLNVKEMRTFQFCYLRNSELAFSLPINKQDKEKTNEFLGALLKKIEEATPSNEHISVLLNQYGLLTSTEMTQLDAAIQQSHNEIKPNENIIHFSK